MELLRGQGSQAQRELHTLGTSLGWAEVPRLRKPFLTEPPATPQAPQRAGDSPLGASLALGDRIKISPSPSRPPPPPPPGISHSFSGPQVHHILRLASLISKGPSTFQLCLLLWLLSLLRDHKPHPWVRMGRSGRYGREGAADSVQRWSTGL